MVRQGLATPASVRRAPTQGLPPRRQFMDTARPQKAESKFGGRGHRGQDPSRWTTRCTMGGMGVMSLRSGRQLAAFEGGDAAFQRRKPGFGLLLSGAGLACELAYHLEFLATNQGELCQRLVHTGTHQGAQLLADPRDRREGATGNASDVVEE